MKGAVIRTLPERGFLFIKDEENRTRFIHANSFVEPLEFHEAKVGTRVEFTPVDNAERGSADSNRLRGIKATLAEA